LSFCLKTFSQITAKYNTGIRLSTNTCALTLNPLPPRPHTRTLEALHLNHGKVKKFVEKSEKYKFIRKKLIVNVSNSFDFIAPL